MRFKVMQVFVFMSLTSCQIYQSDFDCPPSIGVPCTSVSDIQKMILETPDGGPDIFSEDFPSEFTSPCERCPIHNKKGIQAKKRIWVNDTTSENTAVQGHFIYFNESIEGEFCE
jgi:hypothetical protein